MFLKLCFSFSFFFFYLCTQEEFEGLCVCCSTKSLLLLRNSNILKQHAEAYIESAANSWPQRTALANS